jgi:flagellar M-ring protein FliF
MAVLERVSVAAVVDGTYETRTEASGATVKTYVPRTPDEMRQFRDIVVKAMGYMEERQDQVSVECFPFASVDGMGEPEPEVPGWRVVQKEYGRTIANVLLVLLLLVFVVRPLVRTAKGISASADQGGLPPGQRVDMIEGGAEDKEPDFIAMTADQQRKFLGEMSPREKEEFIARMTPRQREAYLANMTVSEKASYYARRDVGKTVNIIKGWLTETGEGK